MPPRVLLLGDGALQTSNTSLDKYEDHRYSCPYGRRFRVLPAAAAAAGCSDSRSGAGSRGPHQEVRTSGS